MKNRIFMLVIGVLIAITLILAAAFILWNFMDKNTAQSESELAKNSVEQVRGKTQTAAEIKENTVEIKDILTNLAGNDKFIKISFAFELDNKKAKAEFEQISFIAKSIVISTLADMTPEQVQGSKGQENLISVLMNKINPHLKEGKLKQIYITDRVLQ